jgi:hypothetical protein
MVAFPWAITAPVFMALLAVRIRHTVRERTF